MTDDLVKRHIEQLRLTGGDLADLCQPLADAIEQLTAERDRLRAELADAAVALDDAGDELSELANVLSQDPHAANLAYTSARTARAALKGETP